jgi:hypothetical protein
MSELAALLCSTRAIIDDTESEYARLPFFVRPLVRRGFVQRTGLDPAGWRKLLAAPPAHGELASSIARLIAHYEGAPARAARGRGATPDELAEVSRRCAARVATLRRLHAALCEP